MITFNVYVRLMRSIERLSQRMTENLQRRRREDRTRMVEDIRKRIAVFDARGQLGFRESIAEHGDENLIAMVDEAMSTSSSPYRGVT